MYMSRTVLPICCNENFIEEEIYDEAASYKHNIPHGTCT